MPKFLEKKLQREYGKNSDIPYKIMNRLGMMHGNKETMKGKMAQKKHRMNKAAEKQFFGSTVSK